MSAAEKAESLGKVTLDRLNDGTYLMVAGDVDLSMIVVAEDIEVHEREAGPTTIRMTMVVDEFDVDSDLVETISVTLAGGDRTWVLRPYPPERKTRR